MAEWCFQKAHLPRGPPHPAVSSPSERGFCRREAAAVTRHGRAAPFPSKGIGRAEPVSRGGWIPAVRGGVGGDPPGWKLKSGFGVPAEQPEDCAHLRYLCARGGRTLPVLTQRLSLPVDVCVLISLRAIRANTPPAEQPHPPASFSGSGYRLLLHLGAPLSYQRLWVDPIWPIRPACWLCPHRSQSWAGRPGLS